MAATALTDRQQQIKALLDQSKTPHEIGEALGITENAVYQHIRRMRSAGHKLTAKPSAAKPKRADKPSDATQLNRLFNVAAADPVSPLAAVRARKDVIVAELKIAEHAVADARTALEKAQQANDRVSERHAAELKTLQAAEAALTAKPAAKAKAPRPQRKRSKPASPSANGASAPGLVSVPAPEAIG